MAYKPSQVVIGVLALVLAFALGFSVRCTPGPEGYLPAVTILRVVVEVRKDNMGKPHKPPFQLVMDMRNTDAGNALALKYIVDGKRGNIYADSALFARMVAGLLWFEAIKGQEYIAKFPVLVEAQRYLRSSRVKTLWTGHAVRLA